MEQHCPLVFEEGTHWQSVHIVDYPGKIKQNRKSCCSATVILVLPGKLLISLFNDVPIVGFESSVYSPGKNVPNFPCIEKQAFLLLVLFWGIGFFSSVTSTNCTPVTSLIFSVIDAQKQVREPHAVTTTRLTTYRLTWLLHVILCLNLWVQIVEIRHWHRVHILILIHCSSLMAFDGDKPSEVIEELVLHLISIVCTLQV